MSFYLARKFLNTCVNKKRITITIVYEDEWILVANKPPKLLTIQGPRSRKEIPTLTEILNADFKKDNLPHRLHPVHRLDRDTSGLIIYAKGKAMQKEMMRLFKERKVKKIYIAFAQGNLSQDKGEIRFPIENETAFTEFKVLGRGKGFTIVEVSPHTGRTNQIRIHFRLLGHPLVGERKFSFRRDFALKANRLCLHAKSLEFVHPMNGKLIKLDSDLPLGMRNFLDKQTTVQKLPEHF
jgi:RluA family pseudouridine synthase